MNLGNEKELVEKILNGDERAADFLYKKLSPFVRGVCFKMTKDADKTEELTQISLIQIFRKLERFSFNSSLSTWAFRIATNQCLMSFRVKKEKLTDSLADHDHILDIASPRTFSTGDKILLEQALKQMPRGYKQIFYLHDVEGFDHEEVAKILKISVGTSKSQLHKARLKLRRLINKKVNPRVYERV